jgi:uncharacterized membrane protein YgcG
VLNSLTGSGVKFIDFMKTRNLQMLPLTIAALAVLALTAGNAMAQNSPTSATTVAPPAAAVQAVPQLSYGVPEVLQLSQAKVSDSVIINYVQNSGNNYGLNAAQIIYLKQQGISSDVINAMINQRSQSAQPAPTSQSYSADANTPQTTTATQPAVTYVQSVPTSSVYVIPDSQTYYYNNWLYYHNPYYGYYPAYYYPYPAVSVSFGWGGGWGGYRGGWHGGGHDGGFHGGGGSHGGGGWHH